MVGIGVGLLTIHGLIAFFPDVYTTLVPYSWLINPQDATYGHLLLTSLPGLAGTLLVSSWLETNEGGKGAGSQEIVAGCLLLMGATGIVFIFLAAVLRPTLYMIVFLYAIITVFISGGFLRKVSGWREENQLEAFWEISLKKGTPSVVLGGGLAVLVGVVLWMSHYFVGRIDEPFTSFAFVVGFIVVTVGAAWFSKSGEVPGVMGAFGVWIGTSMLVGVDWFVLGIVEVFWIVPRPLWPPDHVAPLLVVALTYLPVGMLIPLIASWRAKGS